MAAINDLVRQIADPDLRDRIQKEVDKLSKQKKFGLAFEEHLPECTPLYDIPVKRGAKVALKTGGVEDFYHVLSLNGGKARCIKRGQTETMEFPVDELVTIAEFGDPIYPYLKPLDSVCNAPDSDLWHALIEADNFHALQLLEYLYAGKVDCIYIDPPYNTGARDWKYNNDYVDGSDAYRHSKWLSFMEKRLRLAKKLLNPKDSVLIVTIDEKEYLHLGCLLEELFPEARMQMVSSVISPQGNQRKSLFSRIDEYIFFVEFGEAAVQKLSLPDEWRLNADDKRTTHLHWQQLIRNGANGTRAYSPNLFYPVYVSPDGKKFMGVGDPPPLGVDRHTVTIPEGVIAIWPLHSDGTEGRWACSTDNLVELQKKGYVKLGKLQGNNMYITYLQKGMIEKVENGDFEVEGYNEDGSIISTNEFRSFIPGSQWRIPSHDASRHGSTLLQQIYKDIRFSFPKSLYATHDAIRFFVANKPNALIVDFFAGSGTTLHAVNLLNAEDNGHRRCILVTNNEVSDSEAKEMSSQGLKPGDKDWEAHGIARHVTWPRTVCTIEWHDVNGQPLKGNYFGSDLPMSAGFKSNAVFFHLGCLDKTAVSLGMQFKELLSTLWMKAGAKGKLPEIGISVPDMLILPENGFAVLVNEQAFASFEEALAEYPGIQTVFLATDYEVNYRSMVKNLNVEQSYQLYRDYLDHFRLSIGRN